MKIKCKKTSPRANKQTFLKRIQIIHGVKTQFERVDHLDRKSPVKTYTSKRGDSFPSSVR